MDMRTQLKANGFTKTLAAAVFGGLLVAASALLVAQAGPRGHGHGFGGHHMQRMMDEVGVSDLQREQITAVIDASKPQFKTLFKSMREGRKALKDVDPLNADYDSTVANQAEALAGVTREMVTLRAQVRKDIWQILDAEQRVKAEALKQERRERWREKRKDWKERKGQS